MTINPFSIQQAGSVYLKNLKLKPSQMLEKEGVEEPQDLVSISAEAKKKQLLAEVKNEVIEKAKSIESK